jgi:hypothetical protein
MSARPRLTAKYIKSLAPPAKGSKIFYDGDLAGFGIRITVNDARSFVLNYTTREGRERRLTIGGAESWSAEAARQKARDLKRLIDDGGDPLSAIEEARDAPAVAELIAKFESEHLPRKRPATQADYHSILRKHIAPFFGPHTKVANVAFADIERLHRAISGAGHLIRANGAIRVCNVQLRAWDGAPITLAALSKRIPSIRASAIPPPTSWRASSRRWTRTRTRKLPTSSAY